MNSAAQTTAQPTAQAATPRHPASELLARYRAIFKAAWQHRTAPNWQARHGWPTSKPFYLQP